MFNWLFNRNEERWMDSKDYKGKPLVSKRRGGAHSLQTHSVEIQTTVYKAINRNIVDRRIQRIHYTYQYSVQQILHTTTTTITTTNTTSSSRSSSSSNSSSNSSSSSSCSSSSSSNSSTSSSSTQYQQKQQYQQYQQQTDKVQNTLHIPTQYTLLVVVEVVLVVVVLVCSSSNKGRQMIREMFHNEILKT